MPPLTASRQFMLTVAAGGPAVVVTVSPTNAALQVSAAQQFTATVTGSTNTAVTWSVNGVVGGNATVGTISTAGLYTAPSTVPSPATVTVTATSQAISTSSASAAVVILPAISGTVPVTVAGTTATQAVLTYTAPDTNACVWQVSEDPSFLPPVHDVDASLFAGSNTDGGGPTARTFVVGKKAVGLALDGNKYSRALQANTPHFFRLICGTQVSTGTFVTMNIPLGKTFGEDLTKDAGGNYIFPTIPDVRGFEVIDPLTGAKVKKFGLTSDTSGGFGAPLTFANGGNKECNSNLVAGGFYCVILTTQGFFSLYWVNPADGTTNFLGAMQSDAGADFVSGFPATGEGNWDPADAATFYSIGSTPTTPPKPVILKIRYPGDQTNKAPNTFTKVTATNLTPLAGNQTLQDMIVAFDPTFNPGQFAQNCNAHGVQRFGSSTFLIVACRRHFQDSPAWLVAVDLGDKQPLGSCVNCLRVVAATPMFANPNSRWCGHHSSFYIGDQGSTYAINQQLSNPISTGPYQSSLTGSVDSVITSFPVSGEPVASGAGIAPDGDPTLLNAATGDTFLFQDGTGEFVKITAKNSATSWTVQRGLKGSTPQAHASGANLAARCTNLDTGKPNIWWVFTADPHGIDTTNTTYIVDPFQTGSHRATRTFGATGYDIVESNGIRAGAFPGQFGKPPTFQIDNSPKFAGFTGFAEGNAYQKHPSYDQDQASTVEKTWYLDQWPYSFTNENDVVTPVAGTTSLFKNALDPTKLFTSALPYFAVSGDVSLVDVSGPGSILRDGAVDNFKFCVVKNAGECITGSQPGEIYFNVPKLDFLFCFKGESGAPRGTFDFCIQNTAAFGQSVTQFGLTFDPSNQTGTLTGAPPTPVYGAAKSRVLVRGLVGKYRRSEPLPTAHPTPDGSWAVFPSNAVMDTAIGDTVLMVKIPPYPAQDTVDRTTVINVPVQARTFSGAVSARVKFGFEENGPRTSFFCTQRQETCSVPASLNSIVNVPAITQRVLFFQVEYLNGSGQVVGAELLGAVPVP